MKAYVKPQAYFEDLALAQNIASSCKMKLNMDDGNSCEVEEGKLGNYDVVNGFIKGINADCTFDLDAYCYTTNEISLGLFNS